MRDPHEAVSPGTLDAVRPYRGASTGKTTRTGGNEDATAPPSGDFFGFYRLCLNPATDKLSVPAEKVEIGVCADHRESQRLILTQHFSEEIVVAADEWPWREDRCAAVGFVTVGPSRLGDGILSCPTGHTGPFDVGAYSTAEYYQIDRVDEHTISVGRPIGGGEAGLNGTEFLICRACGRAFSLPRDLTISW